MSEYINFHNQTEILSTESKLFNGLKSNVVSPERPLVPAAEGTHLRVVPDQEIAPYFTEECEIKDTIEPFLMALATARAMMGDPEDRKNYHYWSQWVNVHLLPRFGGKERFQIEVIGRNARGKTWAEPINYPEEESYKQEGVIKEEQQMLEDVLPMMAKDIIKEATNTKLFDEEEQYESREKTIFSFQNFEIMMPTQNPHVKEGGLHLWVHSSKRQKKEGVQSDVKNGLEQFIISQSIAKIIFKELGVPIEIHFSGNWGLPSFKQQAEKVAMGGDPSLNYYQENLSAHANLYGAPPETDRVTLPSRPIYERPDMLEETRARVREALKKGLPGLLQPFENKTLGEVVK